VKILGQWRKFNLEIIPSNHRIMTNSDTKNESKIHNFLQKIKYQLIGRHFYGITGPLRVLPDFIIIGAMKSGTTSLYYNICEHNCIEPASYDEIGYFDVNYHLGLNWYRSMFPTIFKKNKIKKKFGKFLTGEDTPFYFWNPDAAKRIHSILPKIKLIVILRDPIYRAYSQYNNGIRTGSENLSFEDRLEDEVKKLNGNEVSPYEKFFRPRTVLAKGIYVEQLEIWNKIFDKKQIHIISTEELSTNTENTMNSVYNFLELPNYKIKESKKLKAVKYPEMNSKTKDFLIEFYKPHNEKLFKMIGRKFNWSS